MPSLATFANAYRVAAAMAGHTDASYIIRATHDPAQPYRVEPENGQIDAIALISAHDEVVRIWPSRPDRTSEA